MDDSVERGRRSEAAAVSLQRVVVRRFTADASGLELRSEHPGRIPRGRVRVRVQYASIGSTDAVAARGGYLLQPRPGFTPGYDFVGVVERTTPAAFARGLTEGTRVAGCLPRMGSYASSVDVPADALVRVPDTLVSPVAAAMPLDLVTAALALRTARAHPPGPVFVHGASGAVGRLVVQRAVREHIPVIGSSSERNREAVLAMGAAWVDYRDPGLVEKILSMAPKGVQSAIDHTRSAFTRRFVAPTGRIVHLAFAGRPGEEKRATLLGSMSALSRSLARPRERIVSVPLFIALRRSAYLRTLTAELDSVARGDLRAPDIQVVSMDDIRGAFQRVDRLEAGAKLVLEVTKP
ncbi:alcohol dehydrogenase catalytic domain-containing protein [Microbacterium sp. NPDC090218]